ncbi:MAG: hypothetical protein ACON4J_04675 [Parvibaculales bacterium]
MSQFNTDDHYGLLSMPSITVYGTPTFHSLNTTFYSYSGGLPSQTYLTSGGGVPLLDFSNLDAVDWDAILEPIFGPTQADTVTLDFSQLQKHLDAGNLVDFWATLQTDFPDSDYIEIAHDFVTRENDTVVNLSINHAQRYGATEAQLNQISADLAQFYLDFLQSHHRLPDKDIIADMHNQAFTQNGLPEEAWYGNSKLGKIGYPVFINEPVDVNIKAVPPPPPLSNEGDFPLDFNFDFDFDFDIPVIPFIPGVI